MAQNATVGTMNVTLLSAPTVHDCPGTIRFEYETCECLISTGWSITINGFQQSVCGYQTYGCGGTHICDLQLLPGEYDIVATLSGGGCSNTGAVRTFHISIPNAPCIAPVIQITGTTQETGNGCNNGTISFSGSLTQCASNGIVFQLFDSANNLLRQIPTSIYSSNGLAGTFEYLKAGNYKIKANQTGGSTLCATVVNAELTANLSRIPVQVNGGANLITETGPGGCQRHKVVCGYNDDFAQKSCAGSGPQTWSATLRGTTSNGKDILLSKEELYGQQITFLDVPVGNYTTSCSRAIPGPTQGNTESSITVPGSGCSSALTEISRSGTPKGIGCDSAAVIEFEFTSSNCYTTWSLLESTSLLLGLNGNWSANNGQHIFANIPAANLSTHVYEFVAYSDGDPQLDCPASATVTNISTLGCDATVRDSLSKPISAPGASDAEVSFILTSSACLDGPWTVLLKHVTSGQLYAETGQSKNDTIVISGLPAGNYTYGFEYIGSTCSKPDAGAFSLDCSTITAYRDNDGDGYGDPNSDTTICSLYLPFLSGYSGNGSDTNDNLVTYSDNDGDGFGYGSPMPSGVPDNTDFDDNCNTCYPGAPELCDGFDNDGDGLVDTTRMNGLVLYLPLNGNATDNSGNGLSGTINGTVTAVADRFGNASGAMSFPGSAGSHISLADQPLLRPSSITLGAWVKITTPTSLSSFINKSINCYNDSWHFGTQDGYYSTWVSNSTSCGDFVQITSPLTFGTWNYVVFTLDDVADTRKMYVNGTLVATGTYTSSIPYDGNPVLIGAAIENGSLAFPLNGILDDVVIFNRAITAGEVSTLFSNSNPIVTLTTTYYADADGDGFGNPAVSQIACSQPSGFVLNNTDCNDNSAAANPGATEICDGIDNDCDGNTDIIDMGGIVCGMATSEGQSFTLTAPPGKVFTSVDFASYGTPNGTCGNFTIGNCHASSTMAVVQGLVIGQNSVTLTQNYQLFGDPCGGVVKRFYVQARYTDLVPLAQTYYADADADGFGNPAVSQVACNQPSGYVLNNTDCNDNSAAAYPGATEICDGVDNDCDGHIDSVYIVNNNFICATENEAGTLTLTAPPGKVFSVVDFASFGSPNGSCGNFTIGSCHASNSLSIVQGLVIGQNSVTIPVSNSVFGDPCAGTAKRLYVQVRYSDLLPLLHTYYADVDADGYGNPGVSQISCTQPVGYVLDNTDCNDAVASIHPDAPENCTNGIDDDCDGIIDEMVNTKAFILRSGNGIIDRPDSIIHMLVGPNNGGFTAAFTQADFAAAQTGVSPRIRVPDGIWIPSLPADTLSKWIINPVGNESSGLYAINFNILNPFDSAIINFNYAVDNLLGGGPNQGIYLNGQALSGSTTGGDQFSQHNLFRNDIAPLLQTGINTLYINATDQGSPAGLIFSATITVFSICNAQTYYADADGDGFGNPAVSQVAYGQPSGYVLNNSDCNDNSSTAYPGALEICDGIDNDCDGLVDMIAGNSVCPPTITLHLKLFLQGYYTGAGTMQPVLNNQAIPLSLSTETDSITVKLHDPATFTLVNTKKAVLQTNGNVSTTFEQPVGEYYISVSHRNTIQTWSALPVQCSASTPLYDFSTSPNQAFGNNQVEVEPGVWAFFTGDLNQDEFIDGNDFPGYDSDSYNGVNSIYVATDMNGDGFVDGNDFPVFDNNSFNGVTSIHP